MERYYNEEGKMGVIGSPGFGAGFSTWNDIKDLELDKRIIEEFIRIDLPGTPSGVWEDFKGFIEAIHDDIYLGGALDIEYIEPMSPYYIHEYDGHETINVAPNPLEFIKSGKFNAGKYLIDILKSEGFKNTDGVRELVQKDCSYNPVIYLKAI